MRYALHAAVALALITACAEATATPTAVDTEALVASAPAWTPEELTSGLQVDDATRARIGDGVTSLHASMLDVHARQRAAETLAGDARTAAIRSIDADVVRLHEQHKALWTSLDPDVRTALAERLHARMAAHDDASMRSLHERMRQLHRGGH